jgi:hypothetical protein
VDSEKKEGVSMANFIITCALILISSLARIFAHTSPIPIVALALFTAVYLPHQWSAVLVFFGGLFLSDLILGLHALIPVFYAGLIPALFVGFRLRKNLYASEIAGATVLSSLFHFLLTNFGVWVLGGCDWTQAREFPPTFAGLMSAFAVALPGLPEKILADLLGAAVLFGAFPCAQKFLAPFHRLWFLRRRQPYSAV